MTKLLESPGCDTKNIGDHIRTSVISAILNGGVSVGYKQLNLIASKKELALVMSIEFDDFQHLHQNDDESDYYFSVSDAIFIEANVNDHMVTISIAGYNTNIESVVWALTNRFDGAASYVRWVYNSEYLDSMNVAVPAKNLPFTEMYPWLNGETLSAYYDRFIESDASILVLLGQPGTGKTSFLRGLLHHTKQNAILTYHTKLLDKDEFFAEWFRSTKENIVIIEDADTLLAPRNDGNNMMQRFLNLGDGLLSFKGKKMIFTTNLPSVASIDDALMRPGRCHDVIDFKKLEYDQAQTVCEISGVDVPTDVKPYTIAELFSDVKTRKSPTSHKSFGFI